MDETDSSLKLYVQHRAALVEYARPLAGCVARAEDVVQDAYLRFASAAAAGELRHPTGYLYRIVRNLALDLRRRLAAESRHVETTEIDAALPAATPTPEQLLLDQEELRAVAAALAELPPRMRQAFEMHRLGGFPLREIAAELHISVTLVHQLVRSAMTHCANRLDGLELDRADVEGSHASGR
jgi:RNA polymerase sigma factor (sigma-70 family)